mmetsp:Transcript_277/g.331  ORF Transcript_277/g.331 Transcript_277/m.331 type:complete len:96 (+) Transcript_277:494-781(+)
MEESTYMYKNFVEEERESSFEKAQQVIGWYTMNVSPVRNVISMVVTRDFTRGRYPFFRADLRCLISLGLYSLAISFVRILYYTVLFLAIRDSQYL